MSTRSGFLTQVEGWRVPIRGQSRGEYSISQPMNLRANLNQVAHLTLENSLPRGTMGIAWSVRDAGDDLRTTTLVPYLYLMESEGFGAQVKSRDCCSPRGNLSRLCDTGGVMVIPSTSRGYIMDERAPAKGVPKSPSRLLGRL
jgi:hypothetical protein